MNEPSLGKSLLAVFLAPGQAFEILKGKVTWQHWVYPLLIVSVVLSLVPLLYRDITLYEAEQRMEKTWQKILSNPDIPAERLGAIEEKMDKGRERLQEAKDHPWRMKNLLGYLLIPVTVLIISALFALTLMLIGNFGMGGKIPFPALLAAVLFSYLIGGNGLFFNMQQGIGSLELLVKAPFIMMKESTDIVFSFGLLFEKIDSYVKVFLNQLDVFVLWSTAVLGIGFARLYDRKVGNGIAVVGITWLIFMSIGSALTYLNTVVNG